jgi:hypothetical protein
MATEQRRRSYRANRWPEEARKSALVVVLAVRNQVTFRTELKRDVFQ